MDFLDQSTCLRASLLTPLVLLGRPQSKDKDGGRAESH